MHIRSIAYFDADKRYKVYRIDFHSLTELELYLEGDPKVNDVVFSSQKSKYMPESFAGVPLDQAITYCHGGYVKGFPMFLKLKKELESSNVRLTNFRRSVPSVVGSRPNVPNFIAGTPKTMYRLDRAKEKKFIDVYINLAYSGSTTEEQIRNRGILVLNMITLFEQNNMGVNLYAFEASCMNDEIFIADIQLKKPGETINVGKCYYPLCGKEFIRRVLVRVKESMPFQGKWGIGYGGVLREELVRACLGIDETKILVRSPIEIGLKGENIYEDADIFFEELKLSDRIKVPKYGELLREREERANESGD